MFKLMLGFVVIVMTIGCKFVKTKPVESSVKGYSASDCHSSTAQNLAKKAAKNLIAANFPRHLVPVFVCHANFESTFGQQKYSPYCPDCYGTWQIKSGTRGDFCPEYSDAEINTDDLKNAKCALKILNGQGESAWQNVGDCNPGAPMYNCFVDSVNSVLAQTDCKPAMLNPVRLSDGSFNFTYRATLNGKRCGDTIEVFIGAQRIDKRALPASGSVDLKVLNNQVTDPILSVKLYDKSYMRVKSMVKISSLPVKNDQPIGPTNSNPTTPGDRTTTVPQTNQDTNANSQQRELDYFENEFGL